MTTQEEPRSFAPHSTAAAWARYLEATRDAGEERYDDVEQDAWAQLTAALDQIGRRRTGSG
jgi:hypothetical protein